jgi:hypothetical protein
VCTKTDGSIRGVYPRSYELQRPLTRKNAPNTKQSTTVIVRLLFCIHTRKDPSMFEARCGTST